MMLLWLHFLTLFTTAGILHQLVSVVYSLNTEGKKDTDFINFRMVLDKVESFFQNLPDFRRGLTAHINRILLWSMY